MGDQRALHAGVEPDRPRDPAACAHGPSRCRRGAAGRECARSAAGAEAMPAKAPTWMIRSSSSERPGHRSQHRLGKLLGAIHCRVPAARARPRIRRRSGARCTASAPSSPCKRVGDRLQQPFADLIAMLVVDRLEAVDLEGDDDEIVAARAGFARTAARRGRRSPCGCRGRSTDRWSREPCARCSCSARISASCWRST